jgi:tungstate transport system substrate-binding protein
MSDRAARRVPRETAVPSVIVKERKMKKQLMLTLFCVCTVFALFAGGQTEDAGTPAEPIRIKMATTTSTDNSGLLGVLVPAFTEKSGIEVDVIAVGTGTAISYGEAGDVDLIFVHARAREDAFVAEGYGVNRKDVMYNDFVILGPASDSAGVKNTANAAEALAAIASAEADFVSRGDDSGTHIKEKSLWKAAGISPSGRWYKEAGQGMGSVITMTNDLGGYTLTDRGTYLSMKEDLDLEVVQEGDPVLFNPYGIIAVNPEKHPHVKYEAAMEFIDYVVSPEGQKLIGDFKVNGEQLFYPDAR